MDEIKIAWISPIPPCPINSGNRKHLNYILSFFEQKKAKIDFFQYGWEKEAKENIKLLSSRFNKFYFYPQPKEKQMSLTSYWGIDDWISDEFINFIQTKTNSIKYDIVVAEYVWTSKSLNIFNDKVIKIINSHDIFSNRDALLESQGIKKQWFFTRPNEEAKGLTRADIILGITKDDCEYYANITKNFIPSPKIIHCGSGGSFKKLPYKKDVKNKEISFGYLASSNILNKESINRFLAALANFKKPATKFYLNIGGSICPHIPEHENIKIFKKGFISDLDNFYNNCDIIITPMIKGTGLKIKSLEAIEYKRPLIGTKFSTNDLPVNTLWHNFNSVEQMAKYIHYWLDDDNLDKKNQTINYLQEESCLIAEKLATQENEYKKIFWNTLTEQIKNKNFKNTQKNTSISVSIIIPAYNTQNYIERCLESILADKLKSIEIIVIDDGSTDETANIVKKIQKKDIRIKLLQQKNSGQGPARNKGIDIAQGEYLYFIDSDDYIKKDSLFAMYNLSVKNSLDICSPDRPYLTQRSINYISALAGWCCFIKRSIIEFPFSIRQPEIRSGQDGVFSNMLLTRCKKAEICKEADYYYEKRTDSTFNLVANELDVIPQLVEQHLTSLRNFYRTNDIFKSQATRYILFLQDETYKWRFKQYLNKYSKKDAQIIFLAIKSELISHIKNIDTDALKYLDKDFLLIQDLSFNEYINRSHH